MLLRSSLVMLQLVTGLSLLGFPGPQSGSSSDLAAAVERGKQLQSQIVGVSCDKTSFLDCIRPEVQGLQALVRAYTLAKLSASGGNLPALLSDLRQIDDAYAIEQMESFVGAKIPVDWKNRPPFAFRQTLASGEVVITLNQFASGGLAIPQGVVIIQAFRKDGSSYVYADQTGDSISGIFDYRVFQALKSSDPGQLWLLVQGQVGGPMFDLERARVYSFDGYKFQERWSPEDRVDMRLTIDDGHVNARYRGNKPQRYGGDHKCMEEDLQLTAKGLVRSALIDRGGCEDPQTAK